MDLQAEKSLLQSWFNLRGLDTISIATRSLCPGVCSHYICKQALTDLVFIVGFEFYVAFSQSTGISLFDIKFKDERIIYEVRLLHSFLQGNRLTLIQLQLGMQEALAHYAGADPTQGAQYFLDTFFSMGVRMFELVPGKTLLH